MSLSDCEKCWNTPCTCGHGYRNMAKHKRLSLAASVLGIHEDALRLAIYDKVPEVVSQTPGKHPSHVTRPSDASSFDEICTNCGATDLSGGGWGALAEPCKNPKKLDQPAFVAKTVVNTNKILTDLRMRSVISSSVGMTIDARVMREALSTIESLSAELEAANERLRQLEQQQVLNVEWLSNVIRLADGNHTLGAGQLADKLVEAVRASSLAQGKLVQTGPSSTAFDDQFSTGKVENS